MLKFTKIIEHILIFGILILLSAVLMFALIDVGYEIVKQVKDPPLFIISADNLMQLLSLILIIVIGLELLETVKAYLKEDTIHVELVVMVAIIALARKVIVWDYSKYTHMELIAVAITLLALSGSYLMLKKTGIARIRLKKKNKTME